MDPARPTVLYAPTWTQFSSLNLFGEDIVARLAAAGYRVLVKLHENSLDPAVVNSGGVDWARRLQPALAKGGGHLIRSGDASPWLVAADVLITDHSSIGFEYLLLDRPLIRVLSPELLQRANVAPEYVDLIAAASTTIEDPASIVDAVNAAMSECGRLSSARREVAAELFYRPGTATDRALCELYALMELDVPDGMHLASPGHAASAAEFMSTR
jgi:hypothetical protein